MCDREHTMRVERIADLEVNIRESYSGLCHQIGLLIQADEVLRSSCQDFCRPSDVGSYLEHVIVWA